MLAFSLLSIAGSACLVKGLTLESRAAQTSAICSADFTWMQNSKGASPCQVASSVDAFCNNGNWVIQALNATVSYANPNTTSGTASPCTCSWASYNLISACIACQGFPEQTPPWSVYISECPSSQLSDTFFPSNLVLPADVAIPAWAQTDPTQWSGQRFSAAQAKTTASQDKPDFVGGAAVTAPSTKKSNVGAIVGGVIGGLIVVLGAVFLALYIIRRQRGIAPSAAIGRRPDGHMRSLSDVTAASNLKLQEGYSTLHSTPMHPPSSPTILTHNSSVRSVPLFHSMVNSLSPYGTTTSPPPTQPTQSTATPVSGRREDLVEPYTLPPALHNPDSKQALGPQRIYDHPSAPPPMRVDSTRPHTPSRGRYNPPAYEPSVGESSSSPPPHRKQPSTDTMHTITSSRNGGQYNHAHNLSGSAIPEEHPSGHGRQLSGPSVNEKYYRESTVVGNQDLA